MRNEPSAIVGDPTGAGVWMLTTTGAEAEVLHYDAARSALDTYSLGADRDMATQSVTRGGIGVDRNGIVWAGAALELIRYDTVHKALQSFDMEALLKSVADETPLPPEKKGYRVVRSVAVNPDGSKVVVGFDGSQRLLVYEPPKRAWSKLELGPQTALTSVSVSDTGIVAAAVDGLFTGHNVIDVWIGSDRRETPIKMGTVVYRDGEFVGGTGPTVVKASDGSAVPFTIPSHDTAATMKTPRGPFYPIANGGVVAGTFSGFIAFDRNGNLLGTADFPNPPSGITLRMAVDAPGDVWFTQQQQQGVILGRFQPALLARHP